MQVLDRSSAPYICGVEISKVDVVCLVASVEKLGVGLEGNTIGEMVESYAMWIASVGKEEAAFHTCEHCGGAGLNDEACDFCGTSRTSVAAMVVAASAELFTASDLDEAVTRTHQLKANIVAGHWHLGKHLAEIHRTGIWKTRKGADGNQQYKTFSRFCTEELRMTDANVYKLIDVAQNYDEAMVARLGTEKLDLILKAPPLARPALLAKVEDNITLRKLRDEVKDAKKDVTETRDTGRTKAMPLPRPRAREMITMVELEGEKTFPLYSRAGLARGVQVPPTSIEDAVGVHHPVNEVVMVFEVVKGANGELTGKLTVKRER